MKTIEYCMKYTCKRCPLNLRCDADEDKNKKQKDNRKERKERRKAKRWYE